jgi:hypothetical protein
MFSRPVPPLLLLCFHLAFCAFGRSQDAAPAIHEPVRAEQKALEIKNMKLVAWQIADAKRKPGELYEFLETKPQRVIPSDTFDVECEIVGGADVLAADYFVWTTVDFLVAPVTRAYEQMDNGTLSSSVGWGQVTEMRDLKATPMYRLRPGESRRVAIKDLDLNPVLAAFPVGEDGELWPWLIRVTVHVQDRSGKQLASAERTLRLAPSSARKKSHYNDALPNR